MELIITGDITGTFGVDGFLKIVSSSGEYDHFSELKRVYVAFSKRKLSRKKDGWFNVEAIRLIPSFVLLKLEGVDTLEEAKYFVGGEVQVERTEACALLENEFYACDVCCCVRVLLEVIKNDGKACYVPFNNEFIGEVNITEKTIELKKDWVLE